ncbi:helix-turn-helix domain-containing protein, partial [Butyribacter intestini]
MELHERIRFLRKDTLKMSMDAFGKQLGVSRDTINNIERNRLARPEQKLSLLKLMCKEFNVSEKWLLDGEGEMFVSDETEYNALIEQMLSSENEFVKNIFKTFALFDEKDWEALQHMVEKYNSVADSDGILRYDENPAAFVPDTPEKLEKIAPPI